MFFLDPRMIIVSAEIYFKTRMHSSRMRTVRCSDRLGGGQPGGCLPRGVSAQEGVCLGVVTSSRGQNS